MSHNIPENYLFLVYSDTKYCLYCLPLSLVMILKSHVNSFGLLFIFQGPSSTFTALQDRSPFVNAYVFSKLKNQVKAVKFKEQLCATH